MTDIKPSAKIPRRVLLALIKEANTEENQEVERWLKDKADWRYHVYRCDTDEQQCDSQCRQTHRCSKCGGIYKNVADKECKRRSK